MQSITDNMIIYVLSNQEQVKQRLHQRQEKLNQLQQETKEIFFSSVIRETSNTDAAIDISPAAWLRESCSIMEQFSCMYRILFCYEALPEEWRSLLERLYIKHEKWENLPMSSSQISRIRRKALNQIHVWYMSNLTENEIIHQGNLQSLISPRQKNH